jgi:hypothetical protein
MRDTIHKYRLDFGAGEQRVVMPYRAKILDVHEQGEGNLCLWAEIDTHAPMMTRRFIVVGTGWNLDALRPRTHLRTVHCGSFVWHVYELPEPETGR